MVDVIIIGAGISGLSTAHWLREKGVKIKIIEAASQPGGSVKSILKNSFIFDMGPNSALETTPLVREMAENLDIGSEMIYASEHAKNRYILKQGRLISLPTNPVSFLKTDLFSWPAKLRLLREPLVSAGNLGYEESIADFVRRRLGKEFLDYAIDPFVSGVTAGDPEKLSVKSAFPKLYDLEEKYGSILMGAVKGAKERKKRVEASKQSAQLFNFKGGLQQLTDALASQLNQVSQYQSPVIEIDQQQKNYQVKIADGETLTGRAVLSTIPAFQLSDLINFEGKPEKKHFAAINYPSVLVLYLGYHLKDIGRSLDGFGFLIPSHERKKFLGAIWSSTIFPNRAPKDYASFTLFVGGARKDLKRESIGQNMIQEIVDEFQQIMDIDGQPVLQESKFWSKAIPQYNLDHHLHENVFADIEKYNQGFFISGNYRGGISFGDCIKNSKINADRILTFLG